MNGYNRFGVGLYPLREGRWEARAKQGPFRSDVSVEEAVIEPVHSLQSSHGELEVEEVKSLGSPPGEDSDMDADELKMQIRSKGEREVKRQRLG